jgi:endonuclease YncB( thermonuclease family)
MSKKWYLKWWLIIIYAIVAILFASVLLGDEQPKQPHGKISAAVTGTTSPNALGLTDNGPKPAESNITPAVKAPNKLSNLFKIIKVVDGDTMDVDINGKVKRLRLIGMDTPEVVDPRKPVQCFGREASAKAKALLLGQSVGLESDPSQGDLDKYGRTLRYVYLADGRSFNKLMIEEGYAHEYTYNTPYKYQAEYKKAQRDAEANKRGLWADNACQGVTTTPVSSSPTPTTPTSNPAVAGTTGHIFYVSSYHTARYYYCDTDTTWKGLSAKYLKTFNSEAELLKAYPDKTLHEGCK